MSEHAYRTADPEIVERVSASFNALVAWRNGIDAKAYPLGNNIGAEVGYSMFSGYVLRGLRPAPDGAGQPLPDGWQKLKTKGHLTPRRGKAGEAARAWLAENAPPKWVGVVLEESGMPDITSGGHMFYTPGVFVHDGAVWVKHRGEFGRSQKAGEAWEPVPSSSWYLASEAMAAAQLTREAVSRG